jgi:hypothetical protein
MGGAYEPLAQQWTAQNKNHWRLRGFLRGIGLLSSLKLVSTARLREIAKRFLANDPLITKTTHR